MKCRLTFMLPLLLSPIANATGPEADYCHDSTVNRHWENQVADYPKDLIILKLAGLRTGLCQMIDKKQITHEQGTDIWGLINQKNGLSQH